MQKIKEGKEQKEGRSYKEVASREKHSVLCFPLPTILK